MLLVTNGSFALLIAHNESSVNHTDASPKDTFSNLYPTLVECFGIILVGYIAGRKNIVSETQGRGIGIFVTTIALPATIFKSMIQLHFEQVYWKFWLAIFISKATVFIFVAVVTLLITKPGNYGQAGLLGIFVTQSNDFALGLPLCKSACIISMIYSVYSHTYQETCNLIG